MSFILLKLTFFLGHYRSKLAPAINIEVAMS